MINTKTLVKRLLAKVISKPGVDIFLRSDIKNFLYKYRTELNCPDCDDCCPECPAPNELGSTVTETVLTFSGSTLSNTPGFKISPTITANKRLYGVNIIITGATTQAFSVYDSISELSTSLTNVVPNLFGTVTTDNGPVIDQIALESDLTITSDGNESANDLSGITVTVKLYTA
jgi:hypothetical protein